MPSPFGGLSLLRYIMPRHNSTSVHLSRGTSPKRRLKVTDSSENTQFPLGDTRSGEKQYVTYTRRFVWSTEEFISSHPVFAS